MYYGQQTIEQFELLDNKFCVIDGLTCQIKHKAFNAISPYMHVAHTLTAIPTEEAKETEAYRKVKRELRDDWTFSLEENSELRFSILEQLGLLDIAFPTVKLSIRF